MKAENKSWFLLLFWNQGNIKCILYKLYLPTESKNLNKKLNKIEPAASKV